MPKKLRSKALESKKIKKDPKRKKDIKVILPVLVICLLILAAILMQDRYSLQLGTRLVPKKNQAILKWKANTEPDVKGYKVYYGTSPRTNDCPQGGYQKVVDVGKKTSYTVSNLAPGTYYFSVTAYNKSGQESCFSAEGKKNIPAPSKSAKKSSK